MTCKEVCSSTVAERQRAGVLGCTDTGYRVREAAWTAMWRCPIEWRGARPLGARGVMAGRAALL